MKIPRYFLPISYFFVATLSFTIVFFFVFSENEKGYEYEEFEREREQGEAYDALQWWYSQRAGSDGLLPRQAIYNAYRSAKQKLLKDEPRRAVNGKYDQWESIGPNNVGGRVLSLAINPANTNIIWAGSASGGLWKSETKGIGANAWSYVPTGYPTISISAIAIDATNPNVMYIGTGEISYYHYPLVGTPGARASYGMGILKSTDGGATWAQTNLTSTFSQITAIQRIVINPLNTNTIFSATSEGVYKSYDAGLTWTRVHTAVMAMDVAMSPADTNLLLSTHGNLNSSPNQGMYRTTNGGTSWTEVTSGLPTSNFGRTALAFSPSNPQIVYAGVGNGSTMTMWGLYKSTNAGLSWSQVASTQYAASQSWYNNVVAVHPQNENIVYCAGLDLYKSVTGGTALTRKSIWTSGYMYAVPAGGPEGDSSYAHADHHALVFDPNNPSYLLLGTDGGVFASTNGGETFAGRNGGFVTTQFYSGFANSALTTSVAFGGLQDNGVLKYTGSNIWMKVDGGDGGWCAIDPRNDNIVYDEYVRLQMSKSVNGGLSFSSITGIWNINDANFIAPFVLSPSHPDILYAGAKNIFKSTQGGANWFAANGGGNLNGTGISCIGISWTSPDTLMAATGTGTYNASPLFEVFASKNGGATWANVTGTLPSRFPTDIHFDPNSSKNVFITYSGYGGGHVFKTTNLGQTWIDISANLPDIPVQSVVNDPEEPYNIFIGTDLGVYHSSNGGATWGDFTTGMPPTMVTDVTISKPMGILRASTFGNGVYQRQLPRIPRLNITSPVNGENLIAGLNYPIHWTQKYCTALSILYSADNGVTIDTVATGVPAAIGSYIWNVPFTATTEVRIYIYHESDGSLLDSTETLFSIYVNPTVFEGWNIVSYPFTANVMHKDTLFPGAESNAYFFDGGYRESIFLQRGYGYWMKFPTPNTIALQGDSIFADTISVHKGWNMIGSLSRPVSVTQLLESSPGLLISPVYGYNGAYYITDSLLPVRGYWIKASDTGSLSIELPGAYVKRSTPNYHQAKNIISSSFLSTTLEECTMVKVADAFGHEQRLYLGNDKNLPQLENPPLPPAGAFDVRFASNRLVELLPESQGSTVEFPLVISATGFPLRIRTDFKHESDIRFSVLANGKEFALVQGSDVVLHSETQDIILKAERIATMPSAFSLEQNYPNPFNPSTVITFRLSKAEHVRLTVYDLNGRELTVLLDGEQTTGEHRIQWNADGYASGLYFYRLVSESGTLSRKMVLVR